MTDQSEIDISSDAIARAFLDASLDAVCIRDTERRLLLWNAAFSALVQDVCGSQVAIGMRMEDSVSEAQLLQFEGISDRSLQDLFEEPHSVIREITGIDGCSHWIDLRWVPIKVNEEVVSVAEICRDITEEYAFRQQFQRSAELFQEHLTLERDPLFCYEVTPPMSLSLSIEDQFDYLAEHAVLIEANSAYADMLGIDSVEGLIGKCWGYIVSKSLMVGVGHLVVLAENQYDLDDFKSQPYPAQNGVTRTFMHQFKSLRDGGKVLRIWGASREITEREEAQAALKAAEAKYRLLVESTQEAILVIQDEKRKFFNQQLCELTGYSDEEVRTLPLFTCVHPDDLEMVRARYVENINGKGFLNRYEARILTKAGKIKWIQASTSLFEWQQKPARLVLLLDITERVLAQAEVHRQQDALARMGRTAGLEQMAGSITHELNQPLTGIISNAQAGEMLLKRGDCPDEILQDIFNDVISDAKRASEVIRSMREMYRSQKDEFKSLQLNELAKNTVEMLRSEFIQRSVSVMFDLERDLPLLVGNRGQLQQVLINLIANANEAMTGQVDVPLTLTISTVSRDGWIDLYIKDSGPGIQPEEVEKIFEPYATWKPGGSGLGLSICNSIIRVHEGVMTAENIRAGGARVGFSIPINERADI